MIKRVIFDMDNTLMPWKKEYDNETLTEPFFLFNKHAL